jgi:ABC-type transport system substrate-binding protein
VDEVGARLCANPHWRGAAGNVGEVTVVFRDRGSEPLDEWLDGRYDLQLVREAPIAAADTIADRSPTLSTHFLGFNVRNQPMADERVRRALAHAIDSAALVAAAPGVDLAAGTGGAIPPVMPGHSDGAGLAFDPDLSRALLAEAGYPAGEGLPELLVDARPWSPTAALAEQLGAIGVRTRFESPGKHFGVSSEAHIWFAGWHADYPDPDGFYLGLLELGLPLYRDEETDATLAQARASRDRDMRLRLYRDFERLWIGRRAALVPISYARQLVLRRPHVSGLRLNPMGAFHLEQVVIEEPGQAPHP